MTFYISYKEKKNSSFYKNRQVPKKPTKHKYLMHVLCIERLYTLRFLITYGFFSFYSKKNVSNKYPVKQEKKTSIFGDVHCCSLDALLRQIFKLHTYNLKKKKNNFIYSGPTSLETIAGPQKSSLNIPNRSQLRVDRKFLNDLRFWC